MTQQIENDADSSNAPSHIAYTVRDTIGPEGKKSYWTRIGAVWPHSDGKGFNVDVAALPINGRFTLRVATEKQE